MAGTAPKNFDRLEIGGKITLNGTLSINSLSGFRPDAANAFEVLHAAVSNPDHGRFSTIEDNLNNNPVLERVALYAPDGVLISYLKGTGPQQTKTFKRISRRSTRTNRAPKANSSNAFSR